MKPGELLRLVCDLSMSKTIDWITHSNTRFEEWSVDLQENDLVMYLGSIEPTHLSSPDQNNFNYIKLLYGKEVVYCEDFILEKAVKIEEI